MTSERDAPRIAYRLADRICTSRVQRQIGIWGAAIPAHRRTELAQLVATELRLDEKLARRAGLLHDIGKVILDQYITSGYPLFYRSLQKEKNFQEIEKEILGIDHTEVGSRGSSDRPGNIFRI